MKLKALKNNGITDGSAARPIFISYARPDYTRIRPALEALSQSGFRLWYDQANIIPSLDCFDDIAQAVMDCAVVIAFLSQRAAESQFVRKEISFALSKGKAILPVFLEDFEMPAGLELQIGTHQRLDLHRFGAEEFYRRLSASLSRYARPESSSPNANADLGIQIGRAQIVEAPKGQPPFDVEACVFEEDTYLVLSASPEFEEVDEHPMRLMTKAQEDMGQRPGSLVVREGNPLRLLAVIHDLSLDPSWREEWIAAALEAILREADSRSLHSICLPILGSVHGKYPTSRFDVLLRGALERKPHGTLERIWLITGSSREDSRSSSGGAAKSL